MSIHRSFTWINENVEHTDEENARAAALANKWSALKTAEEERYFRRQSDEDEGRYDYQCECEFCITRNHRCDEHGENGGCSLCDLAKTTSMTECELEARRREQEAERDLEIELVEDKLARLGARMMRPYEHWNEDERLMEYMERDRG